MNMAPTNYLFLAVLAITWTAESKRVLLMPFPFSSHIAELKHLGEALLQKGHEVFMYMTPTYPGVEKLKKGDIKLILHEAPEPDFYSGLSQQDNDDLFNEMLLMSYIEDFRVHTDGFRELCSNAISDEKAVNKLKDLQFDLLIVDIFACSRCLLVVVHKLGVPYIGVTTAYEPWLYRNPALPSFVPFNMGSGKNSEQMTFWERFENTVTLLDWTLKPNVEYIGQAFINEYLPEKDKGLSLDTLVGRAQLILIDTDLAVDYPRPSMPNEIMIGGLTTGPAKPLPKDLEEFVSGAAAGIVLVSFGSLPANLPHNIIDKLMMAFSQLQQRVIWRYPHSPPTDVPKNVKLMTWMPQNDILGHKNTKVFITHCGANGQFEGLYHAVPMLNFPLFAEQPYNAKRAEYKGFSITMNILDFESDELVRNIEKLIKDPSYYGRIKRASAIFKDRPMKPTETAVFWIEHVMQYGGQHLRSYALEMPWYKYLMLDIFLFFTAVCLLSMLTIVKLVKFIKCRIFSKDKNKKE